MINYSFAIVLALAVFFHELSRHRRILWSLDFGHVRYFWFLFSLYLSLGFWSVLIWLFLGGYLRPFLLFSSILLSDLRVDFLAFSIFVGLID